MSDHEFENYLALLSRLLRLSGSHREKIAAEFRAHLEDRLEELLAGGMTREEAVRRALEEFGDAAGLAAEFVSIAGGRKRRWIMRVATFTVAATILVAAGLVILWPARNAGPGAAVAVAQSPAEKGKEQPAKDESGDGSAKLAAALNSRMNLDFEDVPLRDVVAYLTEQTGITFHISLKKLEEASVSVDTPVRSHFRNVRLSTFLDLMLKDYELAYVEKDDLIVITTPEDAESNLLIRVYDCRDLLAMQAPPGADKFVPGATRGGPRGMGGGMFSVQDAPPAGAGRMPGAAPAASQPNEPLTEHDLRADQLMNIITTNVDNQTWDEVGGPGSISEYNGLIVVTQTAATHKKVERVLDMLRDAAGLDASKRGKVVR
jgi:hypothetical protein